MIIDKGVVEVGAYYTYIIVGFGLLFQKINENKYNKVFLSQIKGLYLLYNNNNHMNINISAAEEAIIKDALNDYQSNLVGKGARYNTIVNILNKINDAGIVKSERTPNVRVLKEYMFTFEQGGWNTVWAKTLPGARRQALKEYKDSDLNVRMNSVHLATKKGLDSAMSLFY